MTNQTISPSLEPMPPGDKPSRHSVDLVEALGKLARVQVFQIVLVLAAICLVFSIMAPGSFPEWGNIRQIIQNVSILAVLGIGMTFVIVTSGIDLSVGSVLVFSGVVSAKTMAAIGGDGWGVAAVGIVVALGCGLCWGLLNGFLIDRKSVV